MSSPRAVFRIIYGIVYFFLFILLLALLLITPSDTIYQAFVNGQTYNIWIIAVCFLLTVVVVAFIYALRLYINKTVLASIPKSWVPIDKGDVHTTVYKMIGVGLNRSAAIAYEARPRVVQNVVENEPDIAPAEPPRDEVKEDKSGFQFLRLKKAATVEDELGIALPPHQPVWGEIEHFGWASPNSPDLPNLQYSAVLSELPNLIEAKALTLAPPDPTSAAQPPMLDPEAVGLLQRPATMGLREYLGHLADMGVLPMNPTTVDFLTMYECARFSTRPISNTAFRELMNLFADILRNMEPLDASILDPLDEGGDMSVPSESDIDNDAPLATNPTTPRSNLSRSVTASSHGSRVRPHLPGRNSSANTWHQYRTAPTTPKGKTTAAVSRSPSVNSFAQTRRPYAISQSSSTSLRSKASGSSGSVIRLASRADSSDLPYVLTLADRR